MEGNPFQPSKYTENGQASVSEVKSRRRKLKKRTKISEAKFKPSILTPYATNDVIETPSDKAFGETLHKSYLDGFPKKLEDMRAPTLRKMNAIKYDNCRHYFFIT